VAQSSFVAVATTTTDSAGVAAFSLPSPADQGTTELMAMYVDASNITWASTALSQIVWRAQETNTTLLAPTLTASATTVKHGSTDTIVATVLDSQNQPVVGADVTFTVAGSAYVAISMASAAGQRKAGLTTPRIQDIGYVVATDAGGEANVTLFSDAAGSSTVTAAYTIRGVTYTSQALVIAWTDDAVAGPPPGSATWGPSTADFTSLALSATQKKARAGSPMTLTATPSDNAGKAVALQGVGVMFFMTSAGAVVGRAATDNSGHATLVLDSGMPGRFVASAVNSAGVPVVSKPVLVTWPRSFKLRGSPDKGLPIADDGSGLTDQQPWYNSDAQAGGPADSSYDGSGLPGDQLGGEPGGGQDVPDDASSDSMPGADSSRKNRVNFGWVR
jgi:hypothetical protein